MNKKTHKLTEGIVGEIKSLISQKMPLNTIAKKYGVSQPTISNIKSGKIWNNPKPVSRPSDLCIDSNASKPIEEKVPVERASGYNMFLLAAIACLVIVHLGFNIYTYLK